MLRLSCFALVVGVVLGLELNDNWQKFKSTHGKKYSGAEDAKRQEIFKENVQAILQHNLEHDMGEADFTQKINEFSDMTHEEFVKNMCGVRGDRPHKHRKAVKSSERATDDSLPVTIDWRDKKVVSPVKNQGANCGSCWAFSATGAIESAWAIAKGELIVLADQQLLDCANSSNYCFGCNYGWPDQAMWYVYNNNGQDRQECYPYVFHENSKCMYNASCNAVSISDVTDIPSGSEEVLKQAVATIGPISICIDAGQPNFQNFGSGIYYSSNCSQITNHAMLIVGYGTENGSDYWWVKNSWGPTWGVEGYFQLARNVIPGGICGITTSASYPTV